VLRPKYQSVRRVSASILILTGEIKAISVVYDELIGTPIRLGVVLWNSNHRNWFPELNVGM